MTTGPRQSARRPKKGKAGIFPDRTPNGPLSGLTVYGNQTLETVSKFYSGGRLTRLSALPVLTDLDVRSAPVLESRASRLSGSEFQDDL